MSLCFSPPRFMVIRYKQSPLSWLAFSYLGFNSSCLRFDLFNLRYGDSFKRSESITNLSVSESFRVTFDAYLLVRNKTCLGVRKGCIAFAALDVQLILITGSLYLWTKKSAKRTRKNLTAQNFISGRNRLNNVLRFFTIEFNLGQMVFCFRLSLSSHDRIFVRWKNVL